jgi:ankyrin repeat protein
MRSMKLCGVWLALMLAAAPVFAAGTATALIDAIKSGDKQAVRVRLRTPGAINASVQADGTTALHWAAWTDDVEMVRLVLRAGAPVNAANRYGVTPLMMAATNGNAEILEALIAAGADAKAAMPEGETALMTAARSGNAEALRVLLAHGANVNAQESWMGETALMWAAGLDHAAAVSMLVKNKANLDIQSKPTSFPRKVGGQTVLPRGGFSALMYAARQNAMGAARALVEAGANLNLADPEGTTALLLAITNGHFDMAAMLIEAGADPNAADETGRGPLYATVEMNTLEFTHGRPAPKKTSKATPTDIVRLLLTHGANPNQTLKTPVLRRHNSPGNQFLGNGSTPLMRAARGGDIPLMKLLIEHGADPRIKQKNNTTILMLAAGLGRRFDQNSDSLEYERATEEDLLRSVKFCIELGIDVNAANDAGDTALHWAGGEAIKLLVAHGARMDAKNKLGKTPLDVALARRDRSGRQHRPAAVEALKALGAPTTGPVGNDAPSAEVQ